MHITKGKCLGPVEAISSYGLYRCFLEMKGYLHHWKENSKNASMVPNKFSIQYCYAPEMPVMTPGTEQCAGWLTCAVTTTK